MADTAIRNWREQAACLGVDPELFFPTEGRGVAPVEAMRHCVRCPVRIQCLDDCLDTIQPMWDEGVRGGTTERNRRLIRRGHLTRAQAMAAGDRLATRRTDRELAAEKPSRSRRASYRLSKTRARSREQRQLDRKLELERARDVLAAVADDHDLPVGVLAGASKASQVVAARHDAARQLRTSTSLSLPDIGRLLGGRHHTTVLAMLDGGRSRA